MNKFLGIHYIGQCDYGNEIQIICDQITDGQLVWEKLDDNFDTVSSTILIWFN